MAELETRMQEQSIMLDKMESEIEMHYNMIPGFSLGTQSTTTQPMFSKGSITYGECMWRGYNTVRISQ